MSDTLYPINPICPVRSLGPSRNLVLYQKASNHVNLVLGGYFMQSIIKNKTSFNKLHCPICDEKHVLADDKCEQCDVSFEAILVIAEFDTSVRLLPRAYQIQTLSELIRLLSAETIETQHCPHCDDLLRFQPDASGTRKSHCDCKTVSFSLVLKESGEITLACKPVDSPYIETNELRSLSLSEYRQEIEYIAAKVLSRNKTKSHHATGTDSRETHDMSTNTPKHINLKELIEAYITIKADPATTAELVKSTGRSGQAVSKAACKMIDEGRLVKIKRGLYDRPERKLVQNVANILGLH